MPSSRRAQDMLNTALAMEEKGYRFYREAVAKTESPVGRNIFQMLMEDETVHLERIKKIYAALAGGQGWSEEWKQVGAVHADLGTMFRRLAGEHGRNIHAATGDVQALEIGIDFETKAVSFYQEQLQLTAEDLEKQFLVRMIAEEEEHFALLDDMKFYLTNPAGWFTEKERHGIDGA